MCSRTENAHLIGYAVELDRAKKDAASASDAQQAAEAAMSELEQRISDTERKAEAFAGAPEQQAQ